MVARAPAATLHFENNVLIFVQMEEKKLTVQRTGAVKTRLRSKNALFKSIGTEEIHNKLMNIMNMQHIQWDLCTGGSQTRVCVPLGVREGTSGGHEICKKNSVKIKMPV